MKEYFNPETAIKLADINELVAFEDMVAHAVNPYMNERLWGARRHIRELIMPKGFYGNLGDILLEPMEEPCQQLMKASEDGYRIRGGRNLGPKDLDTDLKRENAAKYAGFFMTADATSTGRGVVGQVQTALWYYPTYRYNGNSAGEAIRRVVAIPRLEKQKFRELSETSRQIGFATVAAAMQRPFGGLRG